MSEHRCGILSNWHVHPSFSLLPANDFQERPVNKTNKQPERPVKTRSTGNSKEQMNVDLNCRAPVNEAYDKISRKELLSKY